MKLEYRHAPNCYPNWGQPDAGLNIPEPEPDAPDPRGLIGEPGWTLTTLRAYFIQMPYLDKQAIDFCDAHSIDIEFYAQAVYSLGSMATIALEDMCRTAPIFGQYKHSYSESSGTEPEGGYLGERTGMDAVFEWVDPVNRLICTAGDDYNFIHPNTGKYLFDTIWQCKSFWLWMSVNMTNTNMPGQAFMSWLSGQPREIRQHARRESEQWFADHNVLWPSVQSAFARAGL